MGDGYLCGGTYHYVRMVRFCPICERRRRHVLSQPTSLWYGGTPTCCGCGDSWDTDGEGFRNTRPFQRGWRPRAIALAKAHWRIGVTREQNRRWVMAELERERQAAS